MSKIQHIEVNSELAAGTRGASLGIDALKIASINQRSSYFRNYQPVKVPTRNNALFDEIETPYAKYIKDLCIVQNNVCGAVSDTIQSGDFPLVLAGDHSTAAGTIGGIKLANPDKRIGVIWIDAHADLHTPYTTATGNIHGMPLAIAGGIDNTDHQINEISPLEKDYWEKIKNIGGDYSKINLEDIVFIVARDLESQEQALLDKHQNKNFSIDEVRNLGVKQVAKQALELLVNCDMIYVSFDVDSMDSALSVGTGTPVPHGLSVQEATELNAILVADPKVCAWEIVEINPTLDTVNKMAEYSLGILETTTSAIKARLGELVTDE